MIPFLRSEKLKRGQDFEVRSPFLVRRPSITRRRRNNVTAGGVSVSNFLNEGDLTTNTHNRHGGPGPAHYNNLSMLSRQSSYPIAMIPGEYKKASP